MTTPQSFIDEELKRFDEKFGTLLDLSDIDRPRLKFRKSDIRIFLKSSHEKLIERVKGELLKHSARIPKATLADLLSKIEGMGE